MNRFFCKIFCALSVVAFLACSDEESSEPVLYPDREQFFVLNPNDMASNDSASASLAHGLAITVHPNASYEISFDKDPNFDPPKLQLFRVNWAVTPLNFRQVRSLEAREENGRYVYSFTCEESEMATWVGTLALDDEYYPGTVSNVRFTGEGAYSDHMSLNLVVVGNVEKTLDGFTLQELESELLSNFRKYYTSITIDTLYVNYAHEHPTLGSKYPANAPWLAGRSSEDMMVSELGGWPGISDALDLILVHFIDEDGVLGYSNLFSGNMGGGLGSTVVLGTYYKTPTGEGSLSLSEIVQTAVHETGHFLGLRHTTSTQADMAGEGDYSNLEDGLEDTPYCSKLQWSGLLKDREGGKSRIPSDVRFHWMVPLVASSGPVFGVDDCPDAGNIMFPASTEKEYDGFSEQQLSIIRKSLMIYPH